MTKRGDIVSVALQGDYGKPRPAVVVQTDLLADALSVVICPITSFLAEADFRVTLAPSGTNGLLHESQVMVDKVTVAPRSKIGDTQGSVESWQLREIERALLFVLGIA